MLGERVEVLRGDSDEQMASFMNATLCTVGKGGDTPLAVSIAVYPPEHWREESLTADEVALRLESCLSAITALGFHVEVMVGPDLDYDDPLTSKDPQKVLGAMTEFFDAADEGRKDG